MISENKVFLAGNLTREPELRYTSSSKAICELSLAVTTKFKEGKEETAFVNITVWGAQAEYAGKYFSKGTNVFVTGRLTYESWEDKNGQKRSALKVNADRIQSAGSKRDSGDGEGQGSSYRQYPQEEKNHRYNSGDVPQRRQAPADYRSEQGGVFQTDDGDGIPF